MGALPAPATDVDGDDTSSLTIPDAGNSLRFVQVVYLAPSAGPATASITVLQLASVATTTITVRGTASEVQVSALKAMPTKGCTGSAAKVIQSTTATNNIDAVTADPDNNVAAVTGVTHNQADATICATVSDSMGNKLAGESVVFTATLGTVAPTGETTTARGATSTLHHGATGKSGTTSTVQAWASAKTATVDVQFGGNAAACAITTDPEVLEVGQAGKVSVSATDSEGGPVPDGSAVSLKTVSSVPGEHLHDLEPQSEDLERRVVVDDPRIGRRHDRRHREGWLEDVHQLGAGRRRGCAGAGARHRHGRRFHG